MFENKEKIWCLIGDEYDSVSYNSDTPCKKGSRIFLLKDAKVSDGEFFIYSGSDWDQVCLDSGDITYDEKFVLRFNLPLDKWGKGKLSIAHIEKIQKVIEKMCSSDSFKSATDIPNNVKVDVTSRTW